MEQLVPLVILIILMIVDYIFLGLSAFIPVIGIFILAIRFIIHIIELVIGNATNRHEISKWAIAQIITVLLVMPALLMRWLFGLLVLPSISWTLLLIATVIPVTIINLISIVSLFF